MKSKFIKISLAFSLISFVLTGCPSPTTTLPSETPSSQSNTSTATDSGKPVPYINPGTGSGSRSDEMALSPGATASAPALVATSGASPAYAMPAPSSGPAAMTGTTSDAKTSVPVSNTATGGIATTDSAMIAKPVAPTTTPLRAGNIDDNDKFSDYLDYLKKYDATLVDKRDVLKVDVSNRYVITVLDQNSKSVQDANVQITSNGSSVFKGKTYANGKTIFFPKSVKSIVSDCQQQDCTTPLSGYSITVQKGDIKITQDVKPTDDKNITFNLKMTRAIPVNPNLDIVFLVDSTGSMGDEISSIQKTIKDISSKISDITAKPTIRYSLVAFKDRTDEYRVKRYDFTPNLTYFQEILNELSAGGGGDYRESVNEGLYNAVEKLSWTTTKDAVRLVFLVGDAPPQLGYTDDYKYTDEAVQAAANGIKIYPIAASGLDNSGEYIFRQLALFTNAKFLFLTYGGDEQTTGTTPLDVGKFTDNNLDTLVVNIVKEEFDNLK